jgi:predicted alpha/beta superfamily hydrolase
MEIKKGKVKKAMASISAMALSAFVLCGLLGAQEDANIIIGKKVKLRSDALNKEMELSVHLPDGYADSDESYPVLFTFQTHFEQVSGAVKNLYEYRLIPKMMVVRIDNYEYGYLTPTKVESDPNSGQADLFLRFFKQELFPYLDSHYRTRPYRIVFSNSWGAMFAVHAILARPDVFHAAIASIPWVMYDGDQRFMTNNAERFLNAGKYRHFLYMTMDNESDLLPELDKFVHILKRHPREGFEWEYHYWPEEDHTSTPYRSIYAGLRAIYSGWNKIPVDAAWEGLEGIKNHEAALNKKFGYEIGVSTGALRMAGQENQNAGRFDTAVAIYQYVIDKNPEDAFAYVSLGRAYEAAGQFQKAKDAFEKAYQIAVQVSHPQTKWVKGFLDRIEEKLKKKNHYGRFSPI